MSPDIPSEVLGEIFHFALHAPVSNVDGSSFPWHLGWVCKTWRRALLAYPKLWATITLNLGLHTQYDTLEKVYNRLLLYLRRSGDHPLNLTLHIPAEFNEDQRQTWNAIWKTILSCSHRWESIALAGNDALEFHDLDLCKGNLPLLKRFSICTFSSFDCDVFHQAPCITDVTLCFMYEIVSHRWMFPWSQLVIFKMAMVEISSHALQVLLENLRGIQELHLSYRSGQPPNLSFPPTYLSHLRVLDVNFHQILQVIMAPSLLELRLEMEPEEYRLFGDEAERFDLEVVETFIELSACHLRKLALMGFRAAFAKSLVDIFPYLEELCIDILDGSCNLLELLLTDEQGFVAFPKLRLFTLICGAKYVDEKVETITSILESRNSSHIGAPPSISVVPLEKIVLQLKQEWHIRAHLFHYPIPIPSAFKNAISKWASFKVDVQIDQ